MNNIANHIFIIGMMGSGKSSIAPLLSSQINIPYIDTDRDLIEIMDAEIQDIFQTLTKQKFYDLESTYFLEHVKGKQHIYATGGGIILKQPNRTMLQNNGVTIFLETSINDISKLVNGITSVFVTLKLTDVVLIGIYFNK